MKEVKAKILSNKKIAQLRYRLTLAAPSIAKSITPGQFMHVKCSDGPEPLLRRPFSLHRVKGAHVEILYEVVGRGTELLAEKKAGDALDVIGPLGKGFDTRAAGRRPHGAIILVAGGMGIAPLVTLAERLARGKSKSYVLIGAKAKSQILCEKDFRNLGYEVKIATDDGSRGFKGHVTELLRKVLRVTGYGLRVTTIYSCGPNAMLKEVAKIAHTHDIPCQVSLEEYMACGVGVCLGCPVKIRVTGNGLQGTGHDARRPYPVSRIPNYKYKMVCKDGPVFNAEEIIWS